MTGPEHYREAERLLAQAGDYTAHDGDAVALVQRAQVHAELARVAAYAAVLIDPLINDDKKTIRDWIGALGIDPHEIVKDRAW